MSKQQRDQRRLHDMTFDVGVLTRVAGDVSTSSFMETMMSQSTCLIGIFLTNYASHASHEARHADYLTDTRSSPTISHIHLQHQVRLNSQDGSKIFQR